MKSSNPSVLRPKLVERLLRPRSVAVIGVSSKPGSTGQIAASLLERDGFSGPVHLVGRTIAQVGGRQTVTSIQELPRGIDLAVLTMPAAGVLDAVQQCIDQGMAGAVVFASGFAEMGDDAKAAQDQLARIVNSADFGVAGPNAFGFTNYVDGVDIGFIPGPRTERLSSDHMPAAAIVVQSGALLVHLHAAFTARNLPVAYRISTGNEAVLDLADHIAYLADDDAVDTIALYAEHIRRPRLFLEAVAMARKAGKAIVMMHSGRSRKAQQAAASHTGAIAGDYAVMATLAGDAGVLLVRTLEELVDCAEFLSRYPKLPTHPPAIVTTSGALCAVTLDCCGDLGLELSAISPDAAGAVSQRLPPYSPEPSNPIDLTTGAVADPALIADSVEALSKDPAMGSVLVAVPPGSDQMAIRWLRPLVDAIERVDKPVLLSVLGEEMPLPGNFQALAREKSVLLTRSPERSLRTIAAVTHHGRALARARLNIEPVSFVAAPTLPCGVLPEWRGKMLLRSLGIATPQGKLAASEDEAAQVASAIGYPVVLKVQSAELAHKTDAGAVALNVLDEPSLRRAYLDLTANVRRRHPDLPIDGVLVEEMANKGLEFVVGAKRDPEWGAVLMVGLGGTYVELLRDVRLLPLDLAPSEIEKELLKLQAAALFEGFRGQAAPDLKAVAEVVARIGRLMATRAEILEIDINPLVAFEKGGGVIALDALIAVDGATPEKASRSGDVALAAPPLS
ncbi:MAG TPA: acetate--CoA ligase family protein [Phenylobacterium sp.]|uniref:acetate--CoA ligase family protein n=1 Tax=Phenylobacterium sp. TaxID=1871053 RepID=UPI002B4A00C5|nr:acetate--CoA ligase family protein [Phenylobacterium sp.]HKR90215.1 acetate--CoA ligase family protein [Phenylobacterium sp.]